MSTFQYKFRYKSTERIALHEPGRNLLFWLDSGEFLFSESTFPKKSFGKVSTQTLSPKNPLGKTRDLRRIKIQVGLGCNAQCGYCSQKSYRSGGIRPQPDALSGFVENMQNWFDGGTDGQGAGVQIEFWGGETLLYWETVKALADQLRKLYPSLKFLLFTNGSILSEAMIDDLSRLEIHVCLSHDGLGHEKARGSDPFKDPKRSVLLKKLSHVLTKKKLFSINMTVSKDNYQLKKNRQHIAKELELPVYLLPFSYEILMPFNQATLKMGVQTEEESKKFTQGVLQELRELRLGGAMAFSGLGADIHSLVENLLGQTSLDQMGQRCSMDRPDSLAVDLRGNVLTCQNTSADSKHLLGNVAKFDQISLNTSYHWSQRGECISCPVLQMCKGSCMHLEGPYWRGACDNFFAFYLGVLAFFFEESLGATLLEINGNTIRNNANAKVILP